MSAKSERKRRALGRNRKRRAHALARRRLWSMRERVRYVWQSYAREMKAMHGSISRLRVSLRACESPVVGRQIRWGQS